MRIEPGFQAHVAVRQVGGGQAHDLTDQLIDMHRQPLRRHLFGEYAKRLDNVGGAGAVRANVFQSLNRLFQIGLIALEPAQAGRGIGHDAQQRLADFMGNRSRKLAHDLEVRATRQFRPGTAQVRFHLRA
ncbi:hypothetical protein D3C85_754460 [compost metagenome]